ncbi:hypothetical protein SERLA73DRAFT_174827 [Serpula lacrymans var. lacrymans S7.3]|uniref:SET domain-containing protein n=2 Tax=Serpula lacrymans var. lacrymans TaxID=341189 RepID=F8PIJ3_SERL3|nr:uncharacterized protein SERLADRAFT_456499 [Serpula lacrymans var. lacrymans S7.9]EGO03364.1 hypothetical protein SERLA73DRAFT_174827 [Serpula lacrymans var. lacrymans S7.3]EGO29135.1 hypothetical protein SERLADRAFT_456499 [Serpula lacrymans var. lacrymans S7.9]
MLPPSVEIRNSSVSGRGIWAKEKKEAGSILISVKPHISVLSNQSLHTHCSSCCGPAPPSGLKRCVRCRMVWYCDVNCSSNDWTLHKLECSALKKWSSSAPSPDVAIPSDAVRCLGRILWKRRAEGPESIWAKEIDSMQSHRGSLQPSAFESHTHLAHFLVRFLDLSSPAELSEYGLSTAGDLVDIISKFITNTFTLTSSSLSALGVSVSPLVALINHSCDPNAVIVYPRCSNEPSTEEPLMQVVAIRDIEVDEEILTAYIDTTLPRFSRQKFLKETYNFDCQCPSCTKYSGVDPRESMWCPKSCGGKCAVPTEENSLTRCEKCQTPVTSPDAVLDVLRVGQEALDKAVALRSRDFNKAKQLTTNMIPILTSAGLTPACHPLLALNELHQSLLVSAFSSNLTQSVLDDSVRAAAKYSAGLSYVLREGHPVRGVALADLGKLLAVDEPEPSTSNSSGRDAVFPPSGPRRLKLALETLKQARTELYIGFGRKNEGGEVGKSIRETVVSLERELGVWSQGVRNVLEDMPKPLKS